ncbi:MAG: hypothetical protein ACM3UZ_01710 [Acidobacteriota bacterium]
MGKKSVVIMLLMLLATTMGCSQPTTAVDASGRVTPAGAQKLINGKIEVEGQVIKEATTKEVWDKMKIQIFNTEDYRGGHSYIIDHGKVTRLCGGMSFSPVEPKFITDLNGDKKPEFIFVYIFGSGGVCHRAVGAYSNGAMLRPHWISSWLFDLDKISDSEVELCEMPSCIPSYTTKVLLGKLALVKKDNKTQLTIQFEPKIPRMIRRSFWTMYN